MEVMSYRDDKPWPGSDSICCAGSLVKINDKVLYNLDGYNKARGFSLLTLNDSTCEVSQYRNFDTFEASDRSNAMAEYIIALTPGATVVGLTSDEAAKNLNDAAKRALRDHLGEFFSLICDRAVYTSRES